MHLTRVTIENLRSIRRAEWRAPKGHVPGWHVVLGENASGKTTFLRAIARTLLDIPGAQQEMDPSDWLRDGASSGSAQIDFRGHDGFDKGAGDLRDDATLTLDVDERGEGTVSVAPGRMLGLLTKNIADGWLSLGYGPYRRFTGGEARLEKYAAPTYARVECHLTLFNEGAVLPESVLWVSKLRWRELEEQKRPTRNGRSHAAENEAGLLMKHLQHLLNRSGILPHATKLADVTPEGIFFSVGSGAPRSILRLSDGYKSMLSMIFDIVRHMEESYGPKNIFDQEGRVVAPAVVLVDEIDIHLHPTWQQKIGKALKRSFPNVQFIVTTHSPIVCQAADSLVLLRKGIGVQFEGVELDRMRYGNVLDALSTGVFGEDVTRSKESERMLKRLAELNRRSFSGQDLSEKERKDQARLRSIMRTMDMDRPGGSS